MNNSLTEKLDELDQFITNYVNLSYNINIKMDRISKEDMIELFDISSRIKKLSVSIQNKSNIETLPIIPTNLDECFIALDKIPFHERNTWLNMETKHAMIQAHHGIGQQIRNTWGLWVGENELCKFFKEQYDVDHADDLSSMILIAYHLHKNNKEYNEKLLELAKRYQQHWKDIKNC